MKSFSRETFLVLVISWGSDVSKCHNVYILSDYFIQFRTFPIVDSKFYTKAFIRMKNAVSYAMYSVHLAEKRWKKVIQNNQRN